MSARMLVTMLVTALQAMAVRDARAAAKLPPDSSLRVPDEERYAPLDEIYREPLPDLLPAFPEEWPQSDISDGWVSKEAAAAETLEKLDRNAGINEGYRQSDTDTSGWVPGSRSSGKACTVTWFRREFAPPAGFDGATKRLLALFEGVDRWCRVWVNGKEVGSHVGVAPFLLDLTDAGIGAQNTLAVQVLDDRLNPWANGIWAPVALALAPRVHARQLLIDCRLDSSSIDVRAVLRNAWAEAQRITLTADIGPGSPPVRLVVGLQPGDNQVPITVPIKSPRLWSLDHPHLYRLTLRSGKDVLWRERFGFRDFRIRGGRFHLNGHRLKLMGCQIAGHPMSGNVNFLRESMEADKANGFQVRGLRDEHRLLKRPYTLYFRGLKTMGENVGRPHEDAGHRSRAFYEAADEAGFLIYDDWHLEDDRVESLALDPVHEEMENWLHFVYNYPSVIMFSFGNEFYGEEPARGLDSLYQRFKPLDRQGRPFCASTGRHMWYEGGETDVCDDHSYYGTIGGPPWQYNYDYFIDYRAKTDKRYGKNQKPLICFETIAIASFWHHGNWLERWREPFLNDRVDKSKWLAIATLKAEWGWGEMARRILRNIGLRSFAMDEWERARRQAAIKKRHHEVFRRLGDHLDGWGPHMEEAFLVHPYKYPYTAHAHQGLPEMKGPFPIDTTGRRYIATPGFFQVKRTNSPLFVCADPPNAHLRSGSNLELRLYSINDTDLTREFTVRILVRGRDGNVLSGETLAVGKVQPWSRELRDCRLTVPPSTPTGRYRAELFLFDGGKLVSDNYYDLYVAHPNDLKLPPIPPKRIALYDSASDVFAGLDAPCSRPMLDAAGLKYDLVSDFSKLGDYQVLIIGANSLDEKVQAAGEMIRAWVESGGRLLAFEQVVTGLIPWLSEMQYAATAGGHFVELVDYKHPTFAGLTQDLWDTWSDDYRYGEIFIHCISPLNESVVASGGTINCMSDADIKSIIADVKVGRGVCLLSQALVSRRYGKDSVATRYVNNLLSYILGDDTSHSTPVEGRRITPVDSKACTFIDLRPYVNMGFRDEVADDKTGGWDDTGDNDMRNLPVGIQTMAGVPFDIIDPAANGGKSCIVLRGQPRPYFPEAATGIKVGRPVAVLYLLHASCHTGEARNAPGGVAARYRMRFAGGIVHELPIVVGQNVTDWWAVNDRLPGAVVGWTGTNPRHAPVGLYVTRWDNPNPDVALLLEAIDFVSTGFSVPVLVAVTAVR